MVPFTFHKNSNDYKIISGITSLHPMYGVNSILQYISASFNNSILNDQGVLLPNALIAVYFFGFFISELLKKITHL